jgi:ectoine hydroxylase-related dioxygenase (phytanoyl-CoA dioxygenase family)
MPAYGKLSSAQRRQWDRQGYVVIENVLTADETASLLQAADEVVARSPAFIEQGNGAAHAFKVANAVTKTDAVDALVDHPRVFPSLLALLGPFLQVLGTEIFLRTPGSGGEPIVPWHTDGGPTLGAFLPRRGNPALQLKVQFFLTGLEEQDHGNFMFVPGSQRIALPRHLHETTATPAGAIQLCVRAGDAVIFPWSLWHAVAPNHSTRVRRSITIRYGQLWSRPYDYTRLPDDVLARLTPRRRRLFGDLGTNADPVTFFYPNEDEHVRLMLA